LEKKGIPNSIPLIVPHFFYDISFVQEFLTLSSFIKRKIIVQKKNEFIHVKKLIVAKDTFISKSYIDVIESVEYLRDLNRDGKFFIYRSINHGRSIVNNSEIISIVKKYGFVPIDSSKLTLKEQISLFSGGCKIIGVHGAGLTNIIFRHGRSLDLLEIFPDISLTPDHYKMISKKLDFKYNSLTGKKMDSSNNFYLEPVEFESQVKGFCKIS
jgi:capsular polysaccharide biosynthesis protein